VCARLQAARQQDFILWQSPTAPHGTRGVEWIARLPEDSAMHTADRIRKLGFRRWYERALIESHAWLVTCVLGLILALAAVEIVAERSGTAQLLLGLGAGAVGVAFMMLGWHRYYALLILAERLSGSATCRQCGTYGTFTLVASGPQADEPVQETQEAMGSCGCG
jgi:hypothetical protein